MGRHRETFWYALKVFYNRVEPLRKALKEARYDTYVPMTVVEKYDDGRLKYIQKPIVSSLMFVCCTEKFLREFKNAHSDDFLYYSEPGENTPAPISDREMEIFRKATELAGTGAEYLGSDTCKYCVGDRVRVTEGLYKGLEGYIKRIKHARKLIVSIEGVAVVAISGIHPQYLEKIEQN